MEIKGLFTNKRLSDIDHLILVVHIRLLTKKYLVSTRNGAECVPMLLESALYVMSCPLIDVKSINPTRLFTIASPTHTLSNYVIY